MRSFTVALAITSTLLVSPGWAEEAPFLLERKIPLGEVRGRIATWQSISNAIVSL
jgi:hypothetical protein